MVGKRKLSEVEGDGEESFELPKMKTVAFQGVDYDSKVPPIPHVAFPPLHHGEENEEAVDNPGTSGQTESQGLQEAPTKRNNFTFQECLTMITLECEWNMCSATFKKMEQFCEHISEHLSVECKQDSKDGHLCIWRECGYVCGSKEELDRHVYFHAFHTKLKAIGTVLMEHNSGQCIVDSSGRNMIPEIPEPFQCMWQKCDKKFSSAQAFYWHVQSHVLYVDPDDNKLFQCSWQGCSTIVKNQTRLSDHSRSHTQEKRVGCPNCGGIYCNNTKFFDHYIRQIPLSLQQFQCSHCSTKFANIRLLRDHVRRHINHFKCSECDMTCSTRATLLSHIQYRHSDLKPHKCAQCDKCFKSVMDLNRHMSVHSEDPAFACPLSNCEFTCRAQSTLNKHIKLMHNGMCKEPYVCHICDAKYSLGIFLTRHLIKIHNFHWPAGHSRFRYKQDEDGFYRLQTIRYESIELMQEGDENLQEEMVNTPDTLSAPSTPGIAESTAPLPSDMPLTQRDCNQETQSAEKMNSRIEKALQIKRPNSPKHFEIEQIFLPSEY